MQVILDALPVIIDLLLIVLLVIGIIFGIKCIIIINKANNIINDIEEKIEKFSSVFTIVDVINKYFDTISDKLSFIIEKIKGKFTSKSKKHEEEIEIEEIIKKEGK